MNSQNPSTTLERRHLHLLLPEEIIEEILSRLPVKSLLRFRCVSKSWLSLIKSYRFINTHLKNSSRNTSLTHHRVAYNNVKKGMISACSLQPLLDSMTTKERSPSSSSSSSSSSIITININPPKIDARDLVVGSCNGVLCLLSGVYLKYQNFCLWNPATRVFMELPKCLRSYAYPKLGFGWDETSGAFKVFACYGRSSLGQVYSSKTNSWKAVPFEYRSMFSPVGVVAVGRIHWALRHDQFIESFNLESDEFGRIDLPPFIKAPSFSYRTFLGEIGGCLYTLFDDYKMDHIDIWVMKEYGVTDSWFKRLSFPRNEPRTLAYSPLFGEALDGEIFIIYRNMFVVFNPSEGKAKVSSITTKNVLTNYKACIYVETLVSP